MIEVVVAVFLVGWILFSLMAALGALDASRFVLIEVRTKPLRILFIRSPIRPPSAIRHWIDREIDVAKLEKL